MFTCRSGSWLESARETSAEPLFAELLLYASALWVSGVKGEWVSAVKGEWGLPP